MSHREEILDILRTNDGVYTSGEELADTLVSYKIFSCFFGTKITPLFESLTLE